MSSWNSSNNSINVNNSNLRSSPSEEEDGEIEEEGELVVGGSTTTTTDGHAAVEPLPLNPNSSMSNSMSNINTMYHHHHRGGGGGPPPPPVLSSPPPSHFSSFSRSNNNTHHPHRHSFSVSSNHNNNNSAAAAAAGGGGTTVQPLPPLPQRSQSFTAGMVGGGPHPSRASHHHHHPTHHHHRPTDPRFRRDTSTAASTNNNSNINNSTSMEHLHHNPNNNLHTNTTTNVLSNSNHHHATNFSRSESMGYRNNNNNMMNHHAPPPFRRSPLSRGRPLFRGGPRGGGGGGRFYPQHHGPPPPLRFEPPEVPSMSITQPSSSPPSKRTTVLTTNLPRVPSDTTTTTTTTTNATTSGLDTSILGPHANRAKDVIAVLAELLQDPTMNNNNNNTNNNHTLLPPKDKILGALAKMDAQMKHTQNEIQTNTQQVAQLLVQEKIQTQQQELEKIKQIKQQKEQQIQQEQLLVEQQLQRTIQDKNVEFETQEQTHQQTIQDDILQYSTQSNTRTNTQIQEQVQIMEQKMQTKINRIQTLLQAKINTLQQSQERLQNLQQNYHDSTQTNTKSSSNSSSSVPLQSQNDTDDTDDCSQRWMTRIWEENRRKAAEAHAGIWAEPTTYHTEAVPSSNEKKEQQQLLLQQQQQHRTDPRDGTSMLEWAKLAQKVTGFGDALYEEPSQAPFFAYNEEVHAVIGPVVMEYVKAQQEALKKHWGSLADEYDMRKELYDKERSKIEASRAGIEKKSVVARVNPLQPILESTAHHRPTPSTNPYRRARRGNEVRSEYEQEQIIAELAAKEAMEKRIAFGGSDVPRQVGPLERQMTARFVKNFDVFKFDPLELEADLLITNLWTDTEKCIFLDRFMQHPKDFRKIASFLRNKTAKDCVQFYYDSKQTVPYKLALKEHIMRRKRRTETVRWDATVQAAISCGAVVKPGPSEDKPLIFLLPEDGNSFVTRSLHPLRREILDTVSLDVTQVPVRTAAGEKRRRDPLFAVEPEVAKHIKLLFPEEEYSSEYETKESTDKNTTEVETSTPTRRAPKKWTAAEKQAFVEALEKHGRNWGKLQEAVSTKSLPSIKNFYYDYKKQASRQGDRGKKNQAAKNSQASMDQDAEMDEVASDRTDQPHSQNEPPQEALDPQQQLELLMQQHSALGNLHALPHGHQQLAHAQLSSLLDGRLTRPRLDSQESLPPELLAQAQGLIPSALQPTTSQDQALLRLLQQQQHQHPQVGQDQLISSLLPYLQHHSHRQPGTNMNDWTEAQQLQRLLQLQQQRESLASFGQQSHLNPLGLSSLGSLDRSIRLLLDQQLHQREDPQVALLQRLLAQNRDEDSLALLARALGGQGGGHRHHPDQNYGNFFG